MKCKYCNVDVSPAATTCPKCGHSVMELNPETIAKRKKKKYLIIGIIAITFIFIASTIGITMMHQEQMSDQIESIATKEDVPEASGSLGIKYNLFVERFNENRNVKKAQMEMKPAKKNESVFGYDLTSSIHVSGRIDPKTGALQMLSVFAKPGSQEELVKLVTTIGVTAESLFPSDANNVRKKVLSDLGFKKGGSLKDANNSITQENIRFQFTGTESGYIFTVSDANAE